MIPRAPQGAGETGLTTVPGGATTSINLVYPSELGISGCITNLKAPYTDAFVKGSGELIPAFICFEEPEKSTVTLLLMIVSATLITIGPSGVLSASTYPVDLYVPSGKSTISF